ncbi:MAG: OmpH family outer membrane protein [Odoribacter sp.]|nr:OmpH family outer membrane protein [Odoribacter sp.]
MKKSKLAVGALLAICAMSVASCSKSDSSAAAAAVVPGDTATVNTRYVNMSKVYTNYTLAQELMAEQQRIMIDYQNQAQSRQNELQRMAQTIQQKVNNNVYLSPQSAQADEQAFYNKQQQAQQWSQQREQQIAIYINDQTMRLNDSVRNVIRDICTAHNIDAVLDDTVAYYVSPKLDITDAVIATLNERYKPATAAQAPAAPAAETPALQVPATK